MWLSQATGPCHVQKAAEDLPLPIFFCFAQKDQRAILFGLQNQLLITRSIVDLPAALQQQPVGSKGLPEFISREKVVGRFHRFFKVFVSSECLVIIMVSVLHCVFRLSIWHKKLAMDPK